MKKPARRQPIIFFAEKRRRWLAGSGFDRVVEYFHYPSRRALGLWEYVLSMGTSRIPKGHKQSHAGHGTGYLLHYVRRGELRHVVRGRTCVARPGDICLMDHAHAHAHAQDRPATTDLWWMLFDGRSMEKIHAELGAEDDPLFVNVDRRRFEALFHELWRLVSKAPVAQEPRIHAVIHTVLAELFAARGPRIETPSLIAQKSSLSEKVRMAVNLIEQQHQKNIGLKQIQTLVGMDMYNLAKRFRKEVGMPPIQYLNRYRMEIARRLLSTTDRPVFDVARCVGYVDSDYFSRAFRKIVGKPPLAYRRSARAAERPG